MATSFASLHAWAFAALLAHCEFDHGLKAHAGMTFFLSGAWESASARQSVKV